MPIVKEVKTLKEAEALREEMQKELMTRLERRSGSPVGEGLDEEIKTYEHAFEAARALEMHLLQKRQFSLTLLAAAVAAVATAVYAIAYVIKEFR